MQVILKQNMGWTEWQRKSPGSVIVNQQDMFLGEATGLCHFEAFMGGQTANLSPHDKKSCFF